MDDAREGLLPESSKRAIIEITDSIALGDLNDAQRRISMLQAAVRRHIARTAQQEAAIRTAWMERGATDNLGDVIKTVERMKVDSKEVKLLGKVPSSEDVIKHLGGGDKTRGSCSSQAYAYIGRRGGLDVTDYRGGDSMNFFANRGNIMSIAKDAGGLIEQNINDFTSAKNLFKSVEEGKEYYFAIAEHAAVVRKVGDTMQYLELQSPLSNGWKTLDDKVLKWRFKAKRSRSVRGNKYSLGACLIEASKLQRDKGYRKLLSYINTDAAKQLKGAGGSIK
jgi:YHS domain-containing protein